MAKYPKWGPGPVEALLNILVEDNAWALLRGQKKVKFEDCVPLLFDGNGRRIPRLLETTAKDPNMDFCLNRPEVFLAKQLERAKGFFPVGAKLATVGELQGKIWTLYRRIAREPQLANALKGRLFPVCLPQWDGGDYGLTLDTAYTNAMIAAYKAAFPERTFNPYRRGQLERQVTVVHESHKRFVELMVKGPVVGIMTVPLQGFSVDADREQMVELEKFDFVSLAGGFDFAAAFAGYPETLARDFHTPGLDMSAVQWQSAAFSLYLGAYDDDASFGRRGRLGAAGGYYSGGLFFRG